MLSGGRSPRACHGKCALDSQCVAFTFIIRTASGYPCWLKAAQRVRSMVPVRINGTTSGLVSGWKKRLPKRSCRRQCHAASTAEASVLGRGAAEHSPAPWRADPSRCEALRMNC
eukprot:1140072-Prymnesium_polylepis.1